MTRFKLWLALAPFVLLIGGLLAYNGYLMYQNPYWGLVFLGMLGLGYWLAWAVEYLKEERK